ncbi:MAG: dUTP diphosphatase [Cetobacterium sp.]
MRKAPTNFREVCELQRELDLAVSKPRDNGFTPKERDCNNIVLSTIAECIEFNEELKETHKTWKQKEINEGKQLEELVDILFFIAQLSNYLKEESFDDAIKNDFIGDVNSSLLTLINFLSYEHIDMLCILVEYGCIVNSMGFVLEDIFNEYFRKWNINMGRIEKDWTLNK